MMTVGNRCVNIGPVMICMNKSQGAGSFEE